MSCRSATSTRGKNDFSTRMETYLSTITASDKKLLIKHEFVQSNPSTHDRDTLMRFLDTDAAPQREPVSTILPVDELHERLERIAAIEDHMRELMPATWEPSIFHFASLLLAPIGHLRQLANNPMLINTLDLDNVFVPRLIRLFLASRDAVANSNVSTSGVDSRTSGSKGKRRAVSQGASSNKRRTRSRGDDATFEPGLKLDANGDAICNTALALERKKMDHGRCAVLGTAEPHVCHVIPFSSCKNPEKLATFASCLRPSLPLLLDKDADTRLSPNFTGGVGVSDKLWNMVSLNPQLHAWWGKAYFGLKCLGILPDNEESLVRVQFVWMPRVASIWREDDRDEDELRAYLTNDRSPLVEQGVAAFHLSGRPLSTGDIFDIPVAKADAKKMKMAFDLQWAMIRIAALTGGADVDDALIEDDDDGPPGEEMSPFPISTWLGNVEPGLPDDNADVVVPIDSGQQPLATITQSVLRLPEVKGTALPPTRESAGTENQRI
ncbi:hypothetical protein B0T14DRAFT_290883 [Immersiella caudata]|uniref:HNH nuclease domain-containing protein n=1 Tax=Immersiella caudata TaxID=314043 RepID=A0AA39WEK6_9PEZI|nr:hypothetical protein B0T14DRAFT_290883 [Immersiella caudata]